jgi:hypothetical protein
MLNSTRQVSQKRTAYSSSGRLSRAPSVHFRSPACFRFAFDDRNKNGLRTWEEPKKEEEDEEDDRLLLLLLLLLLLSPWATTLASNSA